MFFFCSNSPHRTGGALPLSFKREGGRPHADFGVSEFKCDNKFYHYLILLPSARRQTLYPAFYRGRFVLFLISPGCRSFVTLLWARLYCTFSANTNATYYPKLSSLKFQPTGRNLGRGLCFYSIGSSQIAKPPDGKSSGFNTVFDDTVCVSIFTFVFVCDV